MIKNFTPKADLETFLPEAQEKLDMLAMFESEELLKIVEGIAEDEPELAVAMLSIIDGITVNEAMVKHVNARGEVARKKDRKTRERNAYMTTGLSKAKRRQIARRAAKTKRANPSIERHAERKRKKAMRKRKALGL